MSGLIPYSEPAGLPVRPASPISPLVPADLAITMELPAYDALALFKATCEDAAIGIAHLREDETWQWVNQRFCDILGYPRDELMTLRLEDITHPDDLEVSLDFARRARLGTLPSYTLEKRYIRRDGTTVWGSLTVSTIRTSPSTPAYFVGFLQDITARRLAEQRLAAQHAASRLLSDAASGRLPKGLMEAICRSLGWDAAVLWTVDWSDDLLRRVDEWVSPRARTAEHTARLSELGIGQELPGRVWSTGDPVWVADLARETTSPHTHHAADVGLHGVVVFPVKSGSVCGVIELYSVEVQPFDRELLRTLTVIGNDIARVLDQARAEEFVREAEALKTAIVDTTLDCVVTVDAECRILEFNPAAERTFGHRRSDVIGKSMPELIIPPSLRGRHAAGFARYLATGSSRLLGQRGEFTAMRADGTEFPVELTVTRIPAPGSPVFTAFIRDITDRKQAEKELQHSLSLLRSTLEATSEGVLVVSHDGKITSHNKRMTEMWGIPDGIIALGKDSLAISYAARKLKHPEQFTAKVRELYADPEAESFDVLEFLDGRIVERTSRPQRIGGKSVGRVWSFRDVTERRRAEEAVRESEERFRSLTEAAVDGVLIHDHGVIIDANPSFCRIFGYTLEEILGRNLLDIIVTPERREATLRQIQSGNETVYETEALRKDGSRVIVEVSARPAMHRGRPVRVGAIHDITERKGAEEALRESEERFRSLTEAAVDGVLIHDGGVIIDANPSFCRMFGYTLEELVGQNAIEVLVAPEKREMTLGKVREGAAAVYETEALRKDGTRLIIEVSGRPATIRGRQVRVAAIHDITARKHAEEAIRESEERFRSLTEAALDGVLVHEEGIILDANPSLCRMFGYELDELVGRNVLDFIVAPESREKVVQRMRAGSTELYEVAGLRKDGSVVVVELSGRSAMYRGRQARVVAIHDITERKRAEEAARRLVEEQAARGAAEAAERRARFLAEASRVLGASFDYHTTLGTLARLAVPALADFCTVDMMEADDRIARVGVAHVDAAKEPVLFDLGRRFVDRVHDGPAANHLRRALFDSESTLVAEIAEEMLLATAVSDEHKQLIMDLRPCSLVAVPLRVADRTIGVLSLMMAESGRRYGQDDLAMAEELARRASLAVENARLFHAASQATRARDEMMGIVAHDLRNPLSTIRMAAELLLEVGGGERPLERKQIEIMRRAADRMNRLIGDLLDVKRIESGTLAVEPRPEAVATVVGDALEMLRPLAKSSSLQLEAAVPDGLPRVLVDPPRVQQVLSNLVGNAIKFTPAGGQITVRAELAPDGVCLAVVDTGPGIPTEQLPHIFGRYWQGKRTDKRGVGLGLAIAKGIVEAHRGRIWVESQVGAGTSFYFTVPAVES
ncbi:MAG: PAS domain S-box protein [Gemmatimonadaceae bacterium]